MQPPIPSEANHTEAFQAYPELTLIYKNNKSHSSMALYSIFCRDLFISSQYCCYHRPLCHSLVLFIIKRHFTYSFIYNLQLKVLRSYLCWPPKKHYSLQRVFIFLEKT